MANLRVRNGNEEQQIPLSSLPLGIGSDPANQVLLKGAKPHHARIERGPDGLPRIVDLASATLVNGEPVSMRTLHHNDVIRVGSSEIIYSAEDDSPAGAAAPAAPRTSRLLLRRRGVLRRRRPVPPTVRREATGPQFNLEDLRLVLKSLVQQHGAEILNESRKILDEQLETYTETATYEQLLRDRENLTRLLEVIQQVNRQRDLRVLLETILDFAVSISGAERGYLVLREGDQLSIRAYRAFDPQKQDEDLRFSHTIVKQVLESGKPVLYNPSNLPASASVQEMRLQSLACVPFRVGDRNIGCLYLDNRSDPDAFSEEDLPVLVGYADQAAIAIENTRLNEAEAQARKDIERLNALLKEKVERQEEELFQVREELVRWTSPPPLRHDWSGIVGRSPRLAEALVILDKVADQSTPVLLMGESGSGKEILARFLHANSRRAGGKFVSVNCAAIAPTLLESELFGHERGAFTGAVGARPGLFEEAHGGTLFLDEIGDMSLEMQAKLLRATEYGEIRRVGGQTNLRVDVRLVSATNRDLKSLVKEGKFREDLYYRINVVQVKLPPLRDRREDIPLLVEHFLQKIARQEGRAPKRVDPRAMGMLLSYHWPGNVRELENEVRRAWALSGETVQPEDLREEIRSQRPAPVPGASSSPLPLKEIVHRVVGEIERKVVLEAMNRCGWKKVEAARTLGISRPTLDAKLAEYGIEKPESLPAD